MIVNALAKAAPKLVAVTLAGMLAIGGFELAAEHIVRFVTTCEPDHLELRGQVTTGCDVVKRWNQLSMCEVAGGTKNDERAGLGTVSVEEGFFKGVFHGGRGSRYAGRALARRRGRASYSVRRVAQVMGSPRVEAVFMLGMRVIHGECSFTGNQRRVSLLRWVVNSREPSGRRVQ